MKTVITGIYDRYAPVATKRVKVKPVPWVYVELKKLMNERDSFLRKYRRTKNDDDFLAYKQERNKVNKGLRLAKLSYNKNFLDKNLKNSESFWKIIKSVYPTKSTTKYISQSFDIDGEASTDASRISNAFCS